MSPRPGTAAALLKVRPKKVAEVVAVAKPTFARDSGIRAS